MTAKTMGSLIEEFTAPGKAARSAKIMSWLDTKLEAIQKGDIADRLIGAQEIAEFFDNYHHFLALGNVDPEMRPEDDLFLPDELTFERDLRAGWCNTPGNPFDEADFE